MASLSPFRPPSSIRWLLRVALAMQCVGHAWWLGQVEATPLMSWLWGAADVGGWELAESTAQWIQYGVAIFLAVAAVIVLVRPLAVVLGGVVAFQLLLTVAMWQIRDGFQLHVAGWELTSPLVASLAALFPFVTQAGRIGLPLVLLLAERHGTEARPWSPAAEWTARVAIALTFAGHGVEALQHYPPFADMLIIASQYTMSESLAMQLLTAIGAIDVTLAVLVLATRWRGVAWYMAMWGLVTAAARIVVLGWTAGWYPAAIRASHFALPLALAVWWRLARQRQFELQSEDD